MNSITRRHFLIEAAAGAVVASQFPSVARGAEPEGKLQLGLIGCGWYGMVNAKAALQVGGVEIVALCDVDADHLEQSAAENREVAGQAPTSLQAL